jgi:hypothetical protein
MGRRISGTLRVLPVVLFACACACTSPSSSGGDSSDDGDAIAQPAWSGGGHHGWGWGWGNGDCHWGWGWHWECGGNGHGNETADVSLSSSHGAMLQTSNTNWTFTKTGALNQLAQTITWTLTATEGATTGADLVMDGDITAKNDGNGSATIGNIVVNLQVRSGNKWLTKSTDVADATNGDNATVAHVVPGATTGGQATYTENAASGSLSFMDRHTNTVFSLVPEVTIPAHGSEKLMFSATFKNTVLNLAPGTKVRAEVVLTFGNHAAGGLTGHNIDINGNGTIDADEQTVRSVGALLEEDVPAVTAGNDSITLSDDAGDIATQGTVTYSNAVFNIGATSGTVTVSYDGGAAGGSITNCATASAGGITDVIAGSTVTIVPPVQLQACNTEVIGPHESTCTPGASGCGWKAGEMLSYTQADWTLDAPAATLLGVQFENVYASNGFSLDVGHGFEMSFDSATAVMAYIPTPGSPGPLDSDVLDPTTTSSGIFGGDVTALALDVDFGDANLLTDTTGVAFGDLSVCSTGVAGLDGKSVRQLLSIAEDLLGGTASPFQISDVDPVVSLVTGAFEDGSPTAFAQQHIVNGPCP